jgi:3-oxoacyl-[acyl-carrier protein] reductase
MRIRFDGKAVVVSGAGHGFGRCIAETFAQLCACVFGCDLSAVELAEIARLVSTRRCLT